MRCPHCDSNLIAVIRVKEKDDYNIREYGCNECGKQFMSIETPKSGKRVKAPRPQERNK